MTNNLTLEDIFKYIQNIKIIFKLIKKNYLLWII